MDVSLVLLALAALTPTLIPTPIPALPLPCEIRVRDSAFRTARDSHRLVLICDSTDTTADATADRLRSWLADNGQDLNVEFRRVNADAEDTDWSSLGIPSAPPALPVTVLVGRDNGIGESFLVDHWEPAPTDEELSAVADSPFRRQLAEALAANIAVLVHAPAGPLDETVGELLDQVISTGMPDERIGLAKLTLDRSDARERTVAAFMGLRPNAPETVVVAFGRGKLMHPPLASGRITREHLATLLEQLVQACSCSRPLPTMGVDLPMVWTTAMDEAVVLMDEELEESTPMAPGVPSLADVSDAAAVATDQAKTTQETATPLTRARGPEGGSWLGLSQILIGLAAVAVVLTLGLLVAVNRSG